MIFQDQLGDVFDALQAGVENTAEWFMILTMNVILLFVFALKVSRYGDVRIEGPDSRPEFSTVGWLAMLFSLGMGIGLLFYGVAKRLGDRNYGPTGNLVDSLATVSTLFGLAPSLGLGAQQVAAGLNAGSRRLSEINLWLAALLKLFVSAIGPTVYVDALRDPAPDLVQVVVALTLGLLAVGVFPTVRIARSVGEPVTRLAPVDRFNEFVDRIREQLD
jgi:choline-glycine betaine transporter